ncbi:recombinase family protein [Campylobacter helveticus]|uniref:recombinase family protein n=1 Tax=Campylobacter helveticus TaxID=28898 RepID=UPI0022EAFF26|nr:recombinase family protein [Campylobacter helveticus]
MVIAYARVSTDKQDNISQERLIKDYCKANSIALDKYISVEISSRKSQEQRQITQLTEILKEGDTLITAELSRLSRSMFEAINIISSLIDKGIEIIFIRQPELNLMEDKIKKLLFGFYAYIAEVERDMISQRTKAGLKVAKEKGVKLGRPVDTLNSKYDKDIDKIKELLERDIPIKSIWKILYAEQGRSYDGLLWYIKKRNLGIYIFNEHEQQIREYRKCGIPHNVICRVLKKGTTANLRKFCNEKGII